LIDKQEVPDWIKETGKAIFTALIVSMGTALGTWVVDEIKSRVKRQKDTPTETQKDNADKDNAVASATSSR